MSTRPEFDLKIRGIGRVLKHLCQDVPEKFDKLRAAVEAAKLEPGPFFGGHLAVEFSRLREIAHAVGFTLDDVLTGAKEFAKSLGRSTPTLDRVIQSKAVGGALEPAHSPLPPTEVPQPAAPARRDATPPPTKTNQEAPRNVTGRNGGKPSNGSGPHVHPQGTLGRKPDATELGHRGKTVNGGGTSGEPKKPETSGSGPVAGKKEKKRTPKTPRSAEGKERTPKVPRSVAAVRIQSRAWRQQVAKGAARS